MNEILEDVRAVQMISLLIAFALKFDFKGDINPMSSVRNIFLGLYLSW